MYLEKKVKVQHPTKQAIVSLTAKRSIDANFDFSYMSVFAYISLEENLFPPQDAQKIMAIHQGDCVQLTSIEGSFQIIGIDDEHNKCWLRRWPLLPKGSPVFEISMQQIDQLCNES